MWETLISAVVAKVRESSYVDSDRVYDYAISRFTGYPTITVIPADNADTQFADTVRNRRTYVVSIRVYQERLERGEEESERIMRQIVDDLISIFDADGYLNDALTGRGFAQPVPASWSFVQGEDVDTRLAEILLECVVIV